jgi:threonine dehydratase
MDTKITSLISVTEIQSARDRLSDMVVKTPFMHNFNLSEKYDCNVYLKREDMQSVRSFKIRGAYNKMASLTKEYTSNGIVCASAGNHAQGVALSCCKLGIKGRIFMPNTTPNQKVEKVKYFGKSLVEVVLIGDTYDDAYEAAILDSNRNNAVFIHPFNDKKVIEGQGTIGAEILEQTDVDLDYLLVAVGGGGLISGVGSYFKILSPKTKIIAIEAKGAPALHESLKMQQVVKLKSIESFADGIAVKSVGDLTFEICKQVVDQNLLIPEGKICSAILSLYNDDAIIVEPAGAVSVAALDFIKEDIRGKNVAIIVCGGNNDIERTQEIKERALLYEGLKHYFIIKFPQRAGALKDFLHVLGPNDDIAHFQYTKKNNRTNGPALVGIELKNSKDFDCLINRMDTQGINYQHLNNNPMLFEMLV